MKSSYLIFLSSAILASAHYGGKQSRVKREISGALDIVTNNAQPIHADVKTENRDSREKPCKLKNFPSNIEAGVVFQVTPAKDATVLKEGNLNTTSLRKTFTDIEPRTKNTDTIELVRRVNRIVTLTVLAVSAAVEFYPVLGKAYNYVHNFIFDGRVNVE